MSYNPAWEASKALPLEHITKELKDFAATGQDLSGRRFSRSPPRVSSVPSTTFEESEPPSPTAQLQDKESEGLYRSTADAQFLIQIQDELGRIRAARDKDLLEHPRLIDLEEAAEANVKYRWIQQGIWDERWEGQPGKIWKHELQDPQSPERPSDAVKEVEVKALQRGRKRKLSDLKKEYHDSSRVAVDHQDRQSSRPCYQFLYQLCQEREWIKMGLGSQGQDQDQDQDQGEGQYQDQAQLTKLDMRAYENVKSRWIKDKVWDDDWNILPGTSWRHERPRRTPDPKGTYRWEDERKAATIERDERPGRWYPMAPAAPLMRIKWPARERVALDPESGYETPRIGPADSVVRQKETVNDSTTSRPRRAAASKAMINMAKTE